MKNLVVPESQYTKTLPLEFAIASLVVGASFLMLATVDLYDDAEIDADEIANVLSERNLPSKLHACHLSRAQMSPKVSLCVRTVRSK